MKEIIQHYCKKSKGHKVEVLFNVDFDEEMKKSQQSNALE